ncbi:hypothetical protein BQ8420_16850 [Nocardiopsis sp. JB363]|nr:hypothetical protein BQ8420_16850 [Nocardiopsis sp. JB363]
MDLLVIARAVHDAKADRVWKIAERIQSSGLLGLGEEGYVVLSKMAFFPF